MELETLGLGLALSLAGFAVKTGLGWAYAVSGRDWGGRLAVSFAVLGMYGVVFAGVFLAARQRAWIRHYELWSPIWRHGVTLHWILAAVIFIWGLVLLRRAGSSKTVSSESRGPLAADALIKMRTRDSRGWLVLVIPCPVCLGLVFLAVATLVLYFPERSMGAVMGLYGAFIGTAMAGALSFIVGRGRRGNRENALGSAMLLVSLYFMLFALLAPRVGELERVYRLASYTRPGNAVPIGSMVMLVFVICGLLAWGFVRAWREKRRTP